jgi:hypothetical protein
VSEHKVEKGITITYPGGHTEKLGDCCGWWLGDGVLHTNVRYVAPLDVGYKVVRGPSFPLVNIRKWEENR